MKRGGEFPCFQNSAPVQEGDGLLRNFTGEFHCRVKILQTVDEVQKLAVAHWCCGSTVIDVSLADLMHWLAVLL